MPSQPRAPHVERTGGAVQPRSAAKTPPNVVQRTYLVWDPESSKGKIGNDRLGKSNTVYQDRFGEEPVVHNPSQQASGTIAHKKGDIIKILAHGDSHHVASMDANAITARLKNQFGETLKTSKIVFIACEAGEILVKRIADAMGKQNPKYSNVTVIGPINETVIIEDGSTRVLNFKQTEQQAVEGEKKVKKGTQKLYANNESLFPYGEGWVGYISVFDDKAELLEDGMVREVIVASRL